MRLFIEKTNVMYPFILNAHLKNSLKSEYGVLVNKVYEMDEAQWKRAETREWLDERTREFSQKLKTIGDEHYFTPFADRPDAVFLWRDRKRKLVNIDDE